jgi:hypothetical protein
LLYFASIYNIRVDATNIVISMQATNALRCFISLPCCALYVISIAECARIKDTVCRIVLVEHAVTLGNPRAAAAAGQATTTLGKSVSLSLLVLPEAATNTAELVRHAR